jgi:hypothetical protein
MLGEPRLIYDSDFWTVERFANNVVRVIRRGKPFGDAAEVERECRPVQQVLDMQGRARLRLLVDSREVAGRNDPTSEKNFAAHRQEMAKGFARVGILVKTSVGMMHAKRLLAEDGTSNVALFSDEALAIAFISEPIVAR